MTFINATTTQAEITITEENGAITAITTPSSPTLLTAYTEGPQGPPGGAAFVHQQTTPATTWTINHNLGYKPSVELLDSGSQEIDGEIMHTSDNQTVVTLNPASAGLARLI
jgi:hypothetical protein